MTQPRAPRHILVTGCASGIGAALARVLLARGDHVWACDVRTDGMQALAALPGADQRLRLQALDVRDGAQWRSLMDAVGRDWPRLDAVLNVAGVLRPDFAPDIREDDIHLQIDVNTKGVILGSQAALGLMLAQRQRPGAGADPAGRIVNIASMAGITPVPGCALYCASKFAVRGYTLSLAQELIPLGLRATVVCPDVVATPMIDSERRRPQAAMIFSGGGPMPAERVVQAVLHALDAPRPPAEIAFPLARHLPAKLAGLAPNLTGWAVRLTARIGQRKQARGLT
ncbi:MAG: SDR family oxidoreductase [Burkholderiales bacterium]|nr:SDR family oxidoreductase [Burkholderiales bacterium]